MVITRLFWKRFVLITLLIGLVTGISIYQYYNKAETEFPELLNLRDQSDDYDALFDNSNYKTFTIEFSETTFENLITNMENHFSEYGDYLDNTMYPVKLTYSDALGNDFTIQQVGFRTKSNTTRNLIRTYDWRDRPVYHQTSFQLQFNETFDYLQKTNIYQALKTREVFNLEQLNFSYPGYYDGDYDKAMITEAYTHQLYREAGLKVANASYGIVYLKIGDTLINYGFFTVVEPIDSEFLKNNFDSDLGGEYGDLFKATDIQTQADLSPDYQGYIGVNTDTLRYTYSLRNNTLDGTRKTFDAFADFVDHINDQDYFINHVDDIIDIDAFARYLAISFLVGNTDDLRYNNNNYYIYFEVYTKKAYIIPFDLDSSLGFGDNLDKSGGYMTDYSVLYNVDDDSVLIENCFSSQMISDLYRFYLIDFIEDFFNYQDFENEFQMAKNLYEQELVNTQHLGNRTFDLRNTETYFTDKIEHVTNEIT